MRRHVSIPWQPGLAVGTLSAAATVGTLIGFGARAGMPARPFNGIARLFFGARADGVWGFDPTITPVGAALHVTLVLASGVVFVTLAGRLRRQEIWRAAALAVAVALTDLVLDVIVASRFLHAGLADVLAPGQLLALHLLLAASLVVGMRLAQGSLRSD